LHAVQNTLAPSKAIDAMAEAKELSEAEEPDITIDIDSDDDMPEEFIDVRGKEKDKDPSPEQKKKETFGVEGEDLTGRDKAYKTFVRIEKDILDAWEVLYDEGDKELFYDYLITNLKLHFDKFDDELQAKLPEITTDEYEAEKEGGEEELGTEEEFEEEELEGEEELEL
jgi:hypothetical protein